MDDLLSSILDDLAGPELKATILEASSLLDDVSYTDHRILIDDAIMTTDNDDSGETFAKIYSIFENAVVSVLNQHSIFVISDTGRLPELVVILRTIVELEHTELDEMVLDVCSMEMAASEKIAEIIQMHTGVPSEETLLILDGVSTKLIDAIIELMKKKISYGAIDKKSVEDIELKKRKIQKLFEGAADNPVYRLLSSGLGIGMFFDTYLDLVDVFGRESSNDELARMLLGLAIISCDNDVNPLDGINKVLEKHISDIDQIAKIIANANSLFVIINQVPALTVSTSN